MDSPAKYEVSAEQVCWHCNTAEFSFECTDELAPPQGLIGQERALKAIQFGLEVDKRGYNFFVTGLTGTGKASAIKRHLQAIIDERKVEGVLFPVYDWCYFHNFADPRLAEGVTAATRTWQTVTPGTGGVAQSPARRDTQGVRQ